MIDLARYHEYAAAMHASLAILITAYARPDLLEAQLQALGGRSDVKLYVAIDGPKGQSDMDRVHKCITLANRFVSDPRRVLARSKNLGCKAAMEEAITWFFAAEPSGLVLEDDVMPQTEAVDIIRKLLNQNHANTDIFHINCFAMPLGASGAVGFRHSRFISSWGWATWRDRWAHYNPSLHVSWAEFKAIREATGGTANALYFVLLFIMTWQGKFDSWAYRWNYSIWRHQGISLTPSNRLVVLMGSGKDATHTLNLNHLGDVQHHLPIKASNVTVDGVIDRHADAALYTNVGRTRSPLTWIKLLVGVACPTWVWRRLRAIRKKLVV